MRLSLRRKLLAALVAVLGIIVIQYFVVSGFSSDVSDEFDTVIDDNVPALQDLENINTISNRAFQEGLSVSILNASTVAQTLGLIDVDAEELMEEIDEEYEEMIEALDALDAAIDQYAATSASAADYAAQLRPLAADLRDTLLAMSAASGDPTRLDEVLEDKEELEEIEETLLSLVADAQAVETTAFDASRDDVDQSFVQTQVYSLALAIVGVGAVLVVGTVWVGGAVRGFQKLTLATAQMAKGAYETRVQLNTGDEIEYLGTAFNQMAATIEQRQDELSTLNRELEQRVQARTLDLQHRERLLAATADGTEQLLRAENWETVVQEVIAGVGRAAGASRIYIFKRRLNEDNGVCDQRYEWVAPGITPEIDNPELKGVPMAEFFPRWVEHFEAGKALNGDVKTFPQSEREILEPQNIVSILVTPIIVDDEWVGFIGFDECTGQRTWSPAEINILSALANNLSSAISRQRVLAQLRALYQTSRDLNLAPNYQDILQAVYEPVRTYGAATVSLSLLELDEADHPAHIRVVGMHGNDAPPLPPQNRFSIAESPIGVVFDQPGIFMIEDVTQDPRLDEVGRQVLTSMGAGAMVEMPLRSGQKPIALLSYRWTEPHAVSPQERTLLEAIFELAAPVVQNRLLQIRLQEAVRELEQSLVFKDQFLATMSHELRTPMNAIMGYTSIVLKRNTADANINNMLERIMANSERLLGLINDVLDISRINAGRAEIVQDPFDLAALVEGWQHDFQQLAVEKGLAFHFDFAADGNTHVVGDEARLTQIVANLVQNAVKFTDEGSVSLRVQREDGNLYIDVTDTGIGIAPTYQHLIFEEFRQVDMGSKRRHSGTGLGLSIVSKLCNLMGGTVTVQSEPGQGSSFSVRVPLRAAELA